MDLGDFRGSERFLKVLGHFHGFGSFSLKTPKSPKSPKRPKNIVLDCVFGGHMHSRGPGILTALISTLWSGVQEGSKTQNMVTDPSPCMTTTPVDIGPGHPGVGLGSYFNHPLN